MLLHNLALVVFTALAYALPPKRGGTREDFLVTSLPGMHDNIAIDDIPLMFSGQLELFPENNTNYFFWKYADNIKRLPENTGKTMFWLNGGPGCSLMDGALLELGPFRVNRDKEIVYNNGSWHKLMDIVFVDQPQGTGFSYGDEYAVELDDVAFNFVVFLERYFDLFPEDRLNEIYVGGESFAGQYIPYIASALLAYNKKHDTKINLKGLIIGNGWISPNEQSLSYVPFFVQAGLIDPSHPEWSSILHQHEECQKIVNRIDAITDDLPHGFEIDTATCELVLSMILKATSEQSGSRGGLCINMYDYTLKDSYPSCGMNWPQELENVTPFLREESVMGGLNLKKQKKWRECSGKVHTHLKALNSVPAIHLLPQLLEELPIFLFNGNRDIICNYLGTENFIKKLTWNGQRGFSEDLTVADWKHDGEDVGYVKTERNLTFINVFDASHMVPYDKPDVLRALIDLLVGNYDKRDGEKPELVTYPIGERYEREQQKAKPEIQEPEEPEEPAQPEDSELVDGDPQRPENGHDHHDHDHPPPSRIDRVILLVALVVGICGIYLVYQAFTARAPSIIKSSPSTGKKKNVQWADQLRRFQEDDPEFQRQKSQGFLSKTLDKLKGTDNRGRYAPAPSGYEDIELEATEGTEGIEDFVIGSDDEGHEQPHESK